MALSCVDVIVNPAPESGKKIILWLLLKVNILITSENVNWFIIQVRRVINLSSSVLRFDEGLSIRNILCCGGSIHPTPIC